MKKQSNEKMMSFDECCGMCAPCAKVGRPAPDFKAKAYQKGKFVDIKLSDFRGKWVVLFFYPLDFTFVCPTEIESFQKKRKDFEKLDAVVIGGSTDSEYSHKAWYESDSRLKGVEFPVISDKTREIAEAYGALVDDSGIALRATYIIDPEGVLQHMSMNNLNIGRSVDETLRILQAFQTGSLCPVEWKPGMKTLGKA